MSIQSTWEKAYGPGIQPAPKKMEYVDGGYTVSVVDARKLPIENSHTQYAVKKTKRTEGRQKYKIMMPKKANEEFPDRFALDNE